MHGNTHTSDLHPSSIVSQEQFEHFSLAASKTVQYGIFTLTGLQVKVAIGHAEEALPCVHMRSQSSQQTELKQRLEMLMLLRVRQLLQGVQRQQLTDSDYPRPAVLSCMVLLEQHWHCWHTWVWQIPPRKRAGSGLRCISPKSSQIDVVGIIGGIRQWAIAISLIWCTHQSLRVIACLLSCGRSQRSLLWVCISDW